MNEPYWTSVVDATYEDIYRYSLKFLGSPEDAREVTQETFLRGFKILHLDEPLSTVRPMLFTIARNLCIDQKRWWNRWLKFFKDYKDPSEESESSVEVEWNPVLELPSRQREVFILRHWQGFSTEETARILGISDGAVKSHLKRAIERLKKTYLKEEN